MMPHVLFLGKGSSDPDSVDTQAPDLARSTTEGPRDEPSSKMEAVCAQIEELQSTLRSSLRDIKFTLEEASTAQLNACTRQQALLEQIVRSLPPSATRGEGLAAEMMNQPPGSPPTKGYCSYGVDSVWGSVRGDDSDNHSSPRPRQSVLSRDMQAMPTQTECLPEPPPEPCPARTADIADAQDESPRKSAGRCSWARSATLPRWLGRSRESLPGEDSTGGQSQRLSERIASRLSRTWEKHANDAAEALSKDGRSVSKRYSMEKRKQRGFLERCVRDQNFDAFCGIVILTNAAWIGWQTNQRAKDPWKDDDPAWRQVDLMYNVYFTCELVFRVLALRLRFVITADWRWNLLDVVIVGIALVEEVVVRVNPRVPGDSTYGVTTLRMLRVLRTVRIIRAIRVMTFFRELRLMVSSITNCLKSLMWACLLLWIIMWLFSVFFMSTVTEYISRTPRGNSTEIHNVVLDAELLATMDKTQEQRLKMLAFYHSSIFRTTLTLFQSVTGGMDWGLPAEALFLLGTPYAIIYVFFVALIIFAVLNVVTAIFIENATRMAMQDKEEFIQNELIRGKSHFRDVAKLFNEADADGSGELSFDAFRKHISDPRVKAFLGALDLDASDARTLFRLMDGDRSGNVDAREFVEGCLRLKGAARAVDMATLLQESKRVNTKWVKFMSHIRTSMMELSAMQEDQSRLLRAICQSPGDQPLGENARLKRPPVRSSYNFLDDNDGSPPDFSDRLSDWGSHKGVDPYRVQL